jgi:hypothetical protein
VSLLPHLTAAVAARLHPLARDDRGDSPIPSTVIIIGLALLAAALLGVLWNYVGGLLDQAPEVPNPGF